MSTLRPPSNARLVLARRRAVLRSTSGGGVMFVVAMTLAVLAGLGAWALQSASLEVKMAGYERQNAQTHYVSEYGVLAASQYMGPGTAQGLITLPPTNLCVSAPFNNPTNGNPNWCAILPDAQSTINSFNSTYAQTPSSAPYALDPSSTTASGSFGYASMGGGFRVEITEGAQVVPEKGMTGASPTTSGTAVFTVTSFGTTEASGTDAGAAYNYSLGSETLRSRIIVPLHQ